MLMCYVLIRHIKIVIILISTLNNKQISKYYSLIDQMKGLSLINQNTQAFISILIFGHCVDIKSLHRTVGFS